MEDDRDLTLIEGRFRSHSNSHKNVNMLSNRYVIDGKMENEHTFEYDEAKSRANEEKHGIGFEEAKRLWDDGGCLAMSANRRGERREMLIARYAGICWVAIYTQRNESIRLISVRRASPKEVLVYERKRAGRDGH